MTKSKLFSSGQSIALATGENYTLKDDEVWINHHIYKRCDLEITLKNMHEANNPEFVGVGIRKRDGVLGLPADFWRFDQWEVDGTQQTSLADCVNNITTAIQCVGSSSAGVTTFLELLDTPSAYAGFEGFNVVVKSDGTGLEFVQQVTEGTFAELQDLIDNDELVVGQNYILTDYQTEYYIEGSNTAPIEEEIENTEIVSTFGFYDPPLDKIGLGDIVTVTELPSGYSGSIQVGDTATVTQYNSGGLLIKFSNALEQVIGLKFEYSVNRFTTNLLYNGITLNDGNGKVVLKPNGVINTEVHDGTPYMDMTAQENLAVPVERLSLTAIAPDQFSFEAESLTFAGDKLEYSFQDTEIKNEDGKVIGTRKGFILRRINKALGIDINKDWRVQRYRRYKMTNNNDWEDYLLTNSTDASLYEMGGNNAFTASNDSLTEEHKYVFPFVDNPEFFTDFTKRGTESNVFLTGQATAASIVYGQRFETVGQTEFRIGLIQTTAENAKDYPIISLDANYEPVDNIEFIFIKDLSNTVFLNLPFQYGESGNLRLEIFDGISLSTFMSHPQIYSNSFRSAVSISNITAIDFALIQNSGTMFNINLLGTSELKNAGNLLHVTFGSFLETVTGFGASYTDVEFDNNTRITNAIFGGKRVDRMKFENTTANKLMIAYSRGQYVSFVDSSFYLTCIKHNNDSFNNVFTLELGTRQNGKKSLYGYYYDSVVGVVSGRAIFNNSLGDMLYRVIDGNNFNIINLVEHSLSQ